MSEIIHKTEPVEHWIVDGKAYRLATEAELGKVVLVADLEITKRKSPPDIERTLECIRDSQYRFEAGGTVWCFAYVIDDSLLQPRTEDFAEFEVRETPTPTKPIDWTKPVRTKDGRAVRVLCTDGPGDYPVAGYIEGEMNPRSWSLNGQIHKRTPHSQYDLENAPQRIQREYWINVYPGSTIVWHCTKERADASIAPHRIACIKITIDCEEGEGL